MTIRRFQMILVFFGAATLIGCLARGSAVYQSEAPCNGCVQQQDEPVPRHVDQTPEFIQASPVMVETPRPRFSVTSNAPPRNRSAENTYFPPQSVPTSIPDPDPFFVPDSRTPTLTPIEDPVFQPIFPDSSGVTTELRGRSLSEKKTFQPRSIRNIPVESQQKYVPRTATRKGFFQKIGDGFKRMLPSKPATKSSGRTTRNARYLSRSGKGFTTKTSRGDLRKNVPRGPVTVMNQPMKYRAANTIPEAKPVGAKVLLPVKTPVFLQKPEPIEESRPRRSIATAQKNDNESRLNRFTPSVKLPDRKTEPSGHVGIEMWPYRPDQPRNDATAFSPE